MKPPYPSLTSEWHNDTYPAISPTNPSLSVTGKTIVVTGGGSGIGRETARAYAEAGAAHVAIMGRTQSTLSETKEIIGTEYPKTDVTTHVADITDECAVGEAARSIGAWDVLILNAAKILAPNSIDKTSLGEWWSVCETNVKGCVVVVQAFLPSHKPSAAIIGVNAGIVQVPPGLGMAAGLSAYTSSKMAQLKLIEFLAAENPDIFIASVHPGIVMTDMLKAGVPLEQREEWTKDKGNNLFDDVKLSAHFILWMTSSEAHFLRGKFVWAEWDVDQLKARAKEIQESQMLTSNVLGWPYEPKA